MALLGATQVLRQELKQSQPLQGMAALVVRLCKPMEPGRAEAAAVEILTPTGAGVVVLQALGI